MAWEWVAPVATAASGAIGVAFTWYAGHQGRQHAERVAKQAAASQLALAREARRADVYFEIWAMVSKLSLIFSHDTTTGADLPVPLPTRDELGNQMVSVTAQVGLYGSPAVQEIYGEWARHVTVLYSNERRVLMSLENATGHVPLLREDYEQARKALAEVNKRLREQMNHELTS